ncbi:protein krueppel-like [Cololabis saira]|uniref:protein krueppel-like n=1 Tax=Cololabis saira TaxID=129043 RepID=UPI002AD53D63|nr:protein krueppel-like [Cololabis saira]
MDRGQNQDSEMDRGQKQDSEMDRGQNQDSEMDRGQKQDQNQDSSSIRTRAGSSSAGLQKHKGKGRLTSYRCDHCKKVLTTSSGLRKHKRIHTGDKPNLLMQDQ